MTAPDSRRLSLPPGDAADILFAEDFDIGPDIEIPASPPIEDVAEPEPEPLPPPLTEADLAEARMAGWNAGRCQGAADARDDRARQLGDAVQAIATQLARSADQAREISERSADAVTRIMLEMLSAMLPTLCDRHGEAEVRAVIRLVMPGLHQEPSVTVWVHPNLAAPVRRECERIGPDLIARMRVVPTESMAPGDVRVAWENGVAHRDSASLHRTVADILRETGLLPPQAPTAFHAHAVVGISEPPDRAAEATAEMARDIAEAREMAHAD